MSKDQLRIPDYLEHILAAIQRISPNTQGMTETHRRKLPGFNPRR